MTLSDLIDAVRFDLDDRVKPYLVDNTDIKPWLNEAVREACVRARLLLDHETASVCQISVVASTATYSFDDSIVVIKRVKFSGTRYLPLDIVRWDQLDFMDPGWDEREAEPRAVAVNLTSRKITFAPIPDDAYTANLVVWRTPLASEEMAESGESPVINPLYHEDLRHWAVYRARSSRDLEIYSPEEADRAEEAFTRRYGPRPSAEELERWQFDRPARAVAHWL